ncbi:MAG: hypothetical protein ABI199_05365 [Bacteroidia bacterium]
MTGCVKEYEIILPPISTAGVYFFTTDSEINYEVRFGRRQDNILHATIVFGVTNEEYDGEEYSLTNKGELYRVMNTIVKVVLLFMQEHPKMMTYEFTGLEKEGESTTKLSARNNLYKRYLPKIFNNSWTFQINGNTILVNKTR